MYHGYVPHSLRSYQNITIVVLVYSAQQWVMVTSSTKPHRPARHRANTRSFYENPTVRGWLWPEYMYTRGPEARDRGSPAVEWWLEIDCAGRPLQAWSVSLGVGMRDAALGVFALGYFTLVIEKVR
jgi:hypothetical protein